jgi:hypothetical protein
VLLKTDAEMRPIREEYKAYLLEEAKALTGMENPNSLLR